MGMTQEYLRWMDDIIDQTFVDKDSISMLELGNQIFEDGTVAKKFFTDRGYNHVSVDLNGEDGSLVKDLTIEKDFIELYDKFDIVTNFGTTEHVEPFESQYTAFKIIHDCLKIGGIAINLNPDVDALDERGKWRKHCEYYYSSVFYDKLADANSYQLLRNEEINGNRATCYVKTQEEFTADRHLFIDEIAIREGGKWRGIARNVRI